MPVVHVVKQEQVEIGRELDGEEELRTAGNAEDEGWIGRQYTGGSRLNAGQRVETIGADEHERSVFPIQVSECALRGLRLPFREHAQPVVQDRRGPKLQPDRVRDRVWQRRTCSQTHFRRDYDDAIGTFTACGAAVEVLIASAPIEVGAVE